MTENKDNKEKKVYVRLTQDWYDELKLYAELHERPMSTVVRMAVIDYLTRQTEDN